MPYTATNDLNDLVETNPPPTGFVNTDLGPAELETRRTFKAVILNEHNSDGTHKSVNGAVLVAGSVPLTALVGGTALGADSVSTADLQAAAVTTAKIANAAVTTALLADKNVTAAKLLSTGDAHILVANGTGGYNEVALSGAATITNAGVMSLSLTPVNQAIAIFADIETTGTDGGTFTSGAWQTRKLNSTVIDSATLFNLAANVLTWSKPGTYYIRAEAVGYKVDEHQIRLWDPTNNVIIADGMPSIAPNGGTEQTISTVETTLTIAAAQTMIVQHRCGTTEAADGFGKNAGFGDNNIFCRITIIKLA